MHNAQCTQVMMENDAAAAVHPTTSYYWCYADRLHTKLALVNGVLKDGHCGACTSGVVGHIYSDVSMEYVYCMYGMLWSFGPKACRRQVAIPLLL